MRTVYINHRNMKHADFHEQEHTMAHTLARSAISAPRHAGGLTFFNAAFAAWRQRRALERLDANARRDLGLTCADVAREAARPVWDVPQSWLV